MRSGLRRSRARSNVLLGTRLNSSPLCQLIDCAQDGVGALRKPGFGRRSKKGDSKVSVFVYLCN